MSRPHAHDACMDTTYPRDYDSIHGDSSRASSSLRSSHDPTGPFNYLN